MSCIILLKCHMPPGSDKSITQHTEVDNGITASTTNTGPNIPTLDNDLHTVAISACSWLATVQVEVCFIMETYGIQGTQIFLVSPRTSLQKRNIIRQLQTQLHFARKRLLPYELMRYDYITSYVYHTNFACLQTV
jgi:hypothetical protein